MWGTFRSCTTDNRGKEGEGRSCGGVPKQTGHDGMGACVRCLGIAGDSTSHWLSDPVENKRPRPKGCVRRKTTMWGMYVFAV